MSELAFDKVDEKQGSKYAQLFPKTADNRKLRAIATELGDKDMVKWENKEREWRLYEDRIPAGVDPAASFGQFVGPDAKKNWDREQEDRAKTGEAIAKAGGGKNQSAEERFPEEQRYYPPKGDGIRQEFVALQKETGVEFRYAREVGAFVPKNGSEPGKEFEKFQTPEMKAKWEAEGKEFKAQRAEQTKSAGKAVDAVGERAAGNDFLADVKGNKTPGFYLASERLAPDVRADQLAAMKKASDREINEAHRLTKQALDPLGKKLYGIQLSAAEARNPGMSKKEFGDMGWRGQKEASGGADLKGDELRWHRSLKGGIAALSAERAARGLVKTKEQAKAAQKSRSSEAPKQAQETDRAKDQSKTAKTQAPEAAKETPKKDTAKKAAGLAAAQRMMGEGQGR